MATRTWPSSAGIPQPAGPSCQHGELVAALFCDAGGTSPNHWLDTLPAEPSIVLDDLPRGPIMDGWVPLSPPARSALVVRTSADRACGAVVVASRAPAAFRVVPAAATARIRALGDLALQVSLLQDRASGLERALGSSRSIGAAIGILMARHLMTVDAAFDRLSEVSQRTNRKLHDAAEDVMATGELPPVRQEVRQR